MLKQSFATALSLDILDRLKSFIIIDIGASRIEVSVFSDSSLVHCGLIRMGVWKFQRVVKNHLLRKFNAVVLDSVVLELLNNLSSGRKYTVGSIEFPSDDLFELLEPYFMVIEDEFLEVFERLGNDQSIDLILSNGIYFTGGDSFLPWLRERIAVMIKAQHQISPDPLNDQIFGVMKVLNDTNKYQKLIMV